METPSLANPLCESTAQQHLGGWHPGPLPSHPTEEPVCLSPRLAVPDSCRETVAV